MDRVSVTPAVQVFLGEAGQEIFAWIHDVDAAVRSRVGAVVCSSFGREELCAHRTVLHLAAAAAAEGMPAIRFDYQGTGDSSGSDTDPDRVDAWVQSVRTAIDALKQHSGVQKVCLIGIRLGVALAALAAAGRDDIAAMVCIAPVVSGKALMREMRMLAGTSAGPTPSKGSAGFLETGGFLLTDQTQSDISAIDLLRASFDRATNFLILDREESPSAKRLADLCSSQGLKVDYRLITGYTAMMEGTNHNVIPHEMILDVKHWLHDAVVNASFPPDSTETLPQPMPRDEPAPFARPIPTVHEAAVNIDGDVPLAGIASIGDVPVTRGAGGESEGVILLSAGIARRIGPSRLYVDLARRWAAAGHTVLRLDLSGIGDSPIHPNHAEQTVYAATAAPEVQEAVKYLFERGGVTRCHVVGMCSGSYHGLKAALAGANVSTLVMVNPLTFRWKEEDVLTSAYADHEVAIAAQSYSRLWREPEKWKRILRGDFKPRKVARTLLQRLRMGVRSVALDMARTFNIHVEGDLGTELEGLANRGVRIRFVFSTNEPGVALLASQAGGSLGRLQRRGMLKQTMIPASDHIFTTLDARARLADQLTELIFGAELVVDGDRSKPMAQIVPAKSTTY